MRKNKGEKKCVKCQVKELETARENFELKIASLSITPDTIIKVLQYAMEAVEATALTGAEKKNAVIDIVRKVVVDAPLDDHTEKILVEMIEDGIVGHTIDIIVSASRGNLNLEGVTGASRVVCTNLMPYLGRWLRRCLTQCLSKKNQSTDE